MREKTLLLLHCPPNDFQLQHAGFIGLSNLFLSYQKAREKSNIRERFSLILQKKFQYPLYFAFILRFPPAELSIATV